MVPNDIQSELKHLYVAVGELLRHFWSCFPVNTPFLEEKVVKMKSNLERFQVTKLCPFQEKIRRQYLSTNLVSHIEEMLQTAYNKLHSWQSRRLMKKTWSILGTHRFLWVEKSWPAVTLETWLRTSRCSHRGDICCTPTPRADAIVLAHENWKKEGTGFT